MIKNIKKKNIFAFTYAEGGAEGTPGTVNIISNHNGKTELSQYETYYNEILFKDILELLPEIEQYFNNQPMNSDWKRVYMGSGHHLFLRTEIYQKVGKKYENMLESAIYSVAYEDIVNICENYDIKKPYTIMETIKGDITSMNYCEAIVNAANQRLLGGGGVDGAIHRAAGKELLEECKTLHGCETGEAKITEAYKLPCEKIIHTVGPVWQGGMKQEPELLAKCYTNSLELARKHGIRSIAFPSISTGVYGYPVEQAAQIAVQTVKTYINRHPKDLDMVIWVLFDDHTKEVYQNALEHKKKNMKKQELNADTEQKIRNLVKLLKNRKDEEGVENPYTNPACAINLEIYLRNMVRLSPSVLLVGEAPGHKGCAKTGIPFTDEYHMMALENHDVLGKDQYDYQLINPSKELEKEQSASCIWNALDKVYSIPVMWNTCPFHPYEPGNISTNRTPDMGLKKEGMEYLNMIISIFPNAKIYPVGRVAEHILDQYKIKHGKYIRHPAHGGATECTEGILNIL